MVGQDTIQTMESRWLRYMPALLRLEDEDESEDASYKALHILDKCLRGTGIGAKSPAVFAEYAVSHTSINHFVDIVLQLKPYSQALPE